MSTDYVTVPLSDRTSKLFQGKNRLIFVGLILLIVISLTITTITFGVLWSHSKSSSGRWNYAVEKGVIGYPALLPNDGEYVQWTILHFNDVYEMLPLDEGRKGGLARVAHLRQLLLNENAHTYTILAGDFLSPSALSQSSVNGTILNGKQMVQTLNTLGVDFVTFGNHEFDLTRSELIQRMNESKFIWICSNLFESQTNQTFSSTIQYKILSIENQINILLIGLTIQVDKPYISIINQTLLISYVKQFLQSLSNVKYDVLIAITHLDLQTDIQLAETIPEINLILGGHEHENYFLTRGEKSLPIYKADANAVTVFIHRCAFNLNTKTFRIYSTLAKITNDIEDHPQTAQVANHWYQLGIRGFQNIGFQPNKTVSCLPLNIQLDGRATSVRNFATLLSDIACQSLLNSTSINQTKIAMFNTGAIRIDDILKGNINQYDILRVFPFHDYVLSLSIPGTLIAQKLTETIRLKGSGSFPVYCGIHTSNQGNTWFVDGKDITTTNLNYTVATISYIKETSFNSSSVTLFNQFNLTQTQALINYLQILYPPC